MSDTPLSAFGTNALIAELRERGDLGLVRPESGEQKRPAASSGGRPSGPSESRQEQDLATNVPAPGLPAPEGVLVVHPDTFRALVEQLGRAQRDNERLREFVEYVRDGNAFRDDPEGCIEWADRLLAAAPEGATE